MIKTTSKQIIVVSDWDDLVKQTYGKPYNFQQQDDCKDRGTHHITVPGGADDFERDTIHEEINGDDMGVSFAAWQARDPKEWNGSPNKACFINMFWERNFYPEVQMIANDLHEKGLLPKGEYVIEIDW